MQGQEHCNSTTRKRKERNELPVEEEDSVNEGDESLHSPPPKKKSGRKLIPKEIRVNKRDASYAKEDLKAVTRVALYGTGTKKNLERLNFAFSEMLDGTFFGGFSRWDDESMSGCWECLVTFQKQNAQLPCKAEIEKFMESIKISCSVDVLGDTITRSVIAFVDRISSFRITVGAFPSHMMTRILEYREERKAEIYNESVSRITGMEVNAENMLRLYHEVVGLREAVMKLGRSSSANRSLQAGLQMSGDSQGGQNAASNSTTNDAGNANSTESSSGTANSGNNTGAATNQPRQIRGGIYNVYLATDHSAWMNARVGDPIQGRIRNISTGLVHIRIERPVDRRQQRPPPVSSQSPARTQ